MFDDKPTLEEIYRLTKENNRMLRSMRRGSYFAVIFRVVMWVGLTVVSWWIYQEYLAPIIDAMLATMEQAQATSAQAQAQFGALQEAMNKLRDFGF